MTAASRVILVPPEPWDEARLVEAARAFAWRGGSLRPGDEMNGLVVLRVEPESGLAPDAATIFELVPTGPQTGERHGVLLVDASASMASPWDASRTRLQAAREAVTAFLRSSAWDGATVLTYAREPRVAAGPAPPQALAASDVLIPAPEGSARAGPALNAAIARLAAEGHAGPRAIVWLSDGVDELGPVVLAATRAKRLGIAIHAVVFAPHADPAFAEAARITGGSVQIVGSPPTIDIPRSPPA